MNPASRFSDFPAYEPMEYFEQVAVRLGLPPTGLVKLDSNENLYGPAPKARRALSELDFPHLYPDTECLALRQALADYGGVPLELVRIGCGSDELIDLLLRACLEPGDRALICPPTFGVYASSIRLNYGVPLEVPLRGDFSLDLPEIECQVARYRPKVMFLASPNNPDGRLPERDEIEALLEMPLLLVLDEAYIEFAGIGGTLGQAHSWIREVERRPNLVVLRTFSKWAGLAGLRVGYGVFPERLEATLSLIKPPYNVNVAGTQAALASLQDLEYLTGVIEQIRRARESMFESLTKIAFLQPAPSQANFILCRVKGMPVEDLVASLAQRGILVRSYHNPYLNNHIRITVGRPKDNARLLAALEELG